MSTPTAPTTTAPLAQKNCHCDLLTWKDPVKTGKVFGTIILTLLVLKTVNLFNIFFHVAYIGLLGMYLHLVRLKVSFRVVPSVFHIRIFY